jgi:hypothetical protein
MRNEEDCIACPEGSYCAGGGAAPSGTCDAGYYCGGGASSATPATATAVGGAKISGQAEAGYYTPVGSGKQLKCR